MCTARTAELPVYAYLLRTSVLVIWGCIAAGTTAPTCSLTIVVVFHEALVTFAPASLQPYDAGSGAVHNQLVWNKRKCCITTAA